tara:strand:- start:2258 stop:3775 length:1518 start_codon:yes stop_codon:yes gene_type:complete
LIVKVFGPPGTGKTTFLINQVDKEVCEGVLPRDIGYFAFTKRASTEAKQRAAQKFENLDIRKDFPYFRTLHSLAFQILSMKKEAMMDSENYNDFAKKIGENIGVEKDDDDFVKRTNNPILDQINLARVREIPLREHYHRSSMDIDWRKLEWIDASYKKYKEVEELYDYTDLLEEVVQRPDAIPKLEVVIVDEAQDLSKLQWRFVHLLTKRSNRTFLAGDDDQAIYSWAGADVKSFLKTDAQTIILDQSYRVPRNIHRMCLSVVEKIGTRQKKTWNPREEEGIIERVSYFHSINFEQSMKEHPDKTWLILASTNYLLNKPYDYLYSQGIYFERNNHPCISSKILSAVIDWEDLRKGKEITLGSVANIYKYIDSQYVKRGYKNLKTALEDGLFTLDILKKEHGLLTEDIWTKVLTKIPTKKVEYLRSLLKRKVRIKEKPLVRLSTIHGAKGAEADIVVLITDVSTKAFQEAFNNPDDARRVTYVALTRAKEKLICVYPEDHNRAILF